jgi:murein L,D-transpeptidase YafK
MIRLRLASLLLLFGCLAADTPANFYQDQLRALRVKAAIRKHKSNLTNDLAKLRVRPNDVQLLLVAYKAEQKLELYVKRTSEKRYRRYATFPICTGSGTLGPKKRKGDGQVPEGVYHIVRFNPYSNFHLSLGLNYPNAEDRRRIGRQDPGGDFSSTAPA